MLVKTATSYSTPTTRCKASPCELVSITAYLIPASRMRASCSCTSSASRVVWRESLGSTASPNRMSTVLIEPTRRPALSSIWWIIVVVVVLPSVPVTPMTTMSALGRPWKVLDISASARRVSGTTTCGQAVPARRWTTAATAPSRSAVST